MPRGVRNDWQFIKIATVAATIALLFCLLFVGCGSSGDPTPAVPPTAAPPITSLCGTIQPTGMCPGTGLANQDLAGRCRCIDPATGAGGLTPGALEAEQ